MVKEKQVAGQYAHMWACAKLNPRFKKIKIHTLPNYRDGAELIVRK